MTRTLLIVIVMSSLACSPYTVPDPKIRPPAPLARYMRESVSVPFSFALMEHRKPRRLHSAAVMLQGAARGLVDWSDPPTNGIEARAVFFTYARNLEHHTDRLEIAARHRDEEDTAYHLQGIRQTCNSCHKFFRDATVISPDVAFDVVLLGGTP